MAVVDILTFRGNSHIYQMQPGRIHSGLTRVVWELNEVQEGDGGTLFYPAVTRRLSRTAPKSGAAGTVHCGRHIPVPLDQR